MVMGNGEVTQLVTMITQTCKIVITLIITFLFPHLASFSQLSNYIFKFISKHFSVIYCLKPCMQHSSVIFEELIHTASRLLSSFFRFCYDSFQNITKFRSLTSQKQCRLIKEMPFLAKDQIKEPVLEGHNHIIFCIGF